MAKDLRAALHALMVATVADEQARGDWTYRAVRPCPVPATWTPGQRVWGDCSKGVEFLCHWVGAHDPMGGGYGPYGNSQTLWLKLQHLDRASELLVGDVVTFGSWGEKHAAMVQEAGLDPLLWSFGHQGSPNNYRLSRDRRPQQYLRNMIPAYVPTPDDRLRARTGFFAWVAWRLGEGDWRHHGEANATVRPDVPKLIPGEWWVRLAQFMLARKKANAATTVAP